MCVCVIVKRPVLPPSVVDGRSRNPLYYYYYACKYKVHKLHQRYILNTRVFTPEMFLWWRKCVLCIYTHVR